MFAAFALNYKNVKAELAVKQSEFDSISKTYEAAEDAVSAYKESKDSVKNDVKYLILKATEDRIERQKDQLESDVEFLEDEMKAFEKETKNETKDALDFWSL